MKVGIVAAGEGSRLREDGIATRKPLVKVHGVPLLERLLRQYQAAGITEAYCIINEESRDVREYIEQRKLALPVHFHVKTTASSMHSLFELAPYLVSDSFVLSTVDSIFDNSELEGFLAVARRSRVDGLLAVTHDSGDENPLWVKMDTSNRILAFQKPESGDPLVTGGLYFFSPRIFDEKAEAVRRKISRLRNFLGLLLERKYALYGHKIKEMVDIDHADDLREAERFLHGVERHQEMI